MKPGFMSPEHVEAMNQALATSSAIAEACRELDRTGTVHYRLSDGPNGEVHWTTKVTPAGIAFGLGKPARADVVIESDYAAMVRAARAARVGRFESDVETPSVTGDLEFAAAIAPVLAEARSIATFEVEFPDV